MVEHLDEGTVILIDDGHGTASTSKEQSVTVMNEACGKRDIFPDRD